MPTWLDDLSSRPRPLGSHHPVARVSARSPAEGGESSSSSSKLPDEFDDVEYMRSFAVNEINGLNLMLMTKVGPVGDGGRERASAGIQLMIDKQVHSLLILSDDQKPVRRRAIQSAAACALQRQIGFVNGPNIASRGGLVPTETTVSLPQSTGRIQNKPVSSGRAATSSFTC